MNIAQHIQNDVITNIPDLLNLQHGNPLGLSPIAQLIIIFVLVEVMAVFDFFIRRRGKDQFYPVLYTLLFLSFVSIYYYCFQSGLPEVTISGIDTPCLGWFCQHTKVGWGVAIFTLAALTHVIYALLCAIMQVAAQLSVEADMIKGKKWKEWKIALGILLLGVSIIGVSSFISNTFAAWTLLVLIIVLAAFALYKIIADSIRCHNPLWGILIGLTYFLGIIAILMFTIECIRGLIFLLAFFIAIFSLAKASKKKPTEKKVEAEAEAEQPAEVTEA